MENVVSQASIFSIDGRGKTRCIRKWVHNKSFTFVGRGPMDHSQLQLHLCLSQTKEMFVPDQSGTKISFL